MNDEHLNQPATPDCPLINLRGRAETIVGRSRSSTVTLGHKSVSGSHARLLVAEGSVVIEDLNSLYGTSVNGVRIVRRRLNEGDLVRFGSSQPYRFLGGSLRVEEHCEGFAINLKSVGFQANGDTLLENVSLDIGAGSFVGLLGPSGAGKSLLLGCIGTTLQPTSGAISFDGGRPLSGDDLAYYCSKLGVVRQDDLLIHSLTVRENARFAARLRLPDLASNAIEEKIDCTLASVGLAKDHGKPVAVIAGGQRKRLSVAIELLMRPRLLILDEPTSGLDPGMQANIMGQLRGLSRQGITVICATHTLETLHYFDSVIVLARRGAATGCIYHGPHDQLLKSFGMRDLADLFDLLAETPTQGESSAYPIPPPDKPTATNELPAAVDTSDASAKPGFDPTPVIPRIPPSGRRIVDQVKLITQRSFLSFVRDKTALKLAIAQPPALAAMILLSQANASESCFVHGFLVVAAIWLGMTLTVRELVRERPQYTSERIVGLRPDGYFFGKTVCAVSIVTIQCIALYLCAQIIGVCVLSGNAWDGLRQTDLVLGSLVIVLAGIGGVFMGNVVSTFAKTEQVAVFFLPLVILPQILFSRMAAGEAAWPWSKSGCIFSPLSNILTAFDKNHAFSLLKGSQLLASLAMLTRPATAAIDMLHCKPDTISASTKVNEWIYLLALVGLLAVASYYSFCRQESHWRLNR